MHNESTVDTRPASNTDLLSGPLEELRPRITSPMQELRCLVHGTKL
jgi:hypothetical protein